MSLRDELHRINQPEVNVSQHEALIEDLRSLYSHTIKLFKDPNVAHIPVHRYNCFAYAFGIAESMGVDNGIVSEICLRTTTLLNDDFVRFLIHSSLKEVARSVSKDCVILYFDEQRITHAGILKGARIVSKWGEGQIWSHALKEVPVKYGDLTRVYRPIAPTAAERVFIDYSKSLHGADEIDDILKPTRIQYLVAHRTNTGQWKNG